MTSSRGTPNDYSIIFCVKPGSRIGSVDEDLENFFQVSANNRLYIDNSAWDDDKWRTLKTCGIKLVSTLNKVDDLVVTYHNGWTDPACSIHGHHWHIGAHLLVHPTRDSRWGRSIHDLGVSSGEIVFKSEIAKDVRALTRHICLEPRKLVWQKGERYSSFIEEAATMNAMDQDLKPIGGDNWDAAALREDRNFFRVMCLKQLMCKYDICDPSLMRKRLMLGNQKDYNNYTRISVLYLNSLPT